MLQSLFRPVLRPIMMGVMSVTGSRRAWTPSALWPNGVDSPGMWIDPSLLTASFNDYTGTTPVAVPGTVADSANPVGLALDIRAGATTVSDPGNHMLQATSAARPLESARVNLLTYTEDFGNAAWVKDKLTQASGVADPLGGTSAFTLTATSNLSRVYQGATISLLAPGKNTQSIWMRRRTGTGTVKWHVLTVGDGPNIPVTATWTQFYYPDSTGATTAYYGVKIDVSGDAIDVWHPQLNIGPTALPYQRVGAASDYTATGFPIYQKYDGTDDSMATASFAAGTLINGMDCMIAVRRDSGANCVAGLYNGIADATKFFGMAESASGSGCVGSGAGTPTVWVDNTQLTGGTAVTRGTLHTALTAGSYHILEFRNLDLSAWTATGFGLYTSYVFPGARGDIMLFESTASTEDKDKARQYLADKYGVTLP